MALGWYVAAIRRRGEKALLSGLAQLEVETYSPSIVALQRHRRLLEPLFPGYVFCRVDPLSELWPRVKWARGIKYFLGPSGAPTLVEPELLARLQAKVVAWNRGGWVDAFAPGERVRVARGTLAGLEALFQQYLPARERCEVLASLVGRWVPVTVDVGDLELLMFRRRFAEAV